MLINSVILFLRDALPIFILIALILSLQVYTTRILVRGVLLGLAGCVLISLNLSGLSELYEGSGFELVKCLLIALLFAACSIIYLFPTQKSPLVNGAIIVAIASIIVPNASSFIVYFAGFWSNTSDNLSLSLGTILGIGISLSVATLTYLSLLMLRSARLNHACLLIFCAGQTAQITSLLQQINWLSGENRLWDTSHWVSDTSEYGHLFNAIFGYEATPNTTYLIIYGIALTLPIALKRLLNRQANSTLLSQEVKL